MHAPTLRRFVLDFFPVDLEENFAYVIELQNCVETLTEDHLAARADHSLTLVVIIVVPQDRL